MTVHDLQDRMPSDELTEWMAYWRLEPFGAWRDNWHHAQMLSMTFNANRGRRQQPMHVGDFFYKDQDTIREEQSRKFMKGLDMLAVKNG